MGTYRIDDEPREGHAEIVQKAATFSSSDLAVILGGAVVMGAAAALWYAQPASSPSPVNEMSDVVTVSRYLHPSTR